MHAYYATQRVGETTRSYSLVICIAGTPAQEVAAGFGTAITAKAFANAAKRNEPKHWVDLRKDCVANCLFY